MAEELAKKKRIRAGHRTSVTKLLHQAETALTGTPDVTKLTTFKMTLNEKIKTLSTLDDDVANLLDDEGALADDIDQADLYKQRIYTVIVSIDEAITPAPPTPPAPSTATATSSRDDPLPADAACRVKLPKLTIRPFDGDITKWTSFWDSYESAIHTNSKLSEVDKFNYLQSLLERTAREAISGLSLTAANYKEAVEILRKRFGSKQQIISKHMDILLHLDPVASTSARALRHLYDRIEANVRGLKSLGVDSETYGSLLSPVLLNKLPSDIRLIASREISEEDWTLDALLKIVEREVEARERAGGTQARTSERSASTLIASSSPGSPTCCYCQQGHSSNNCRSVTDLEERRRILKRTGRCYVCLRRGHMSRSCRSTTRCYKCKGKHHSSICPAETPKDQAPKDEPQTNQVTPSSQPSAGSKPGLNPNAPTFPSSTLLTVANKAVLLQTAQANIYDPARPQHTLKVRLILDGGSQHSYISNRAKETLHLAPEDECQLAIAAFGSKRSGAQRCEVVRVGVQTHDGPDPTLTLLTVPYICEPLSTQPISLCPEMYDHLSSLELADTSDGNKPMEVDILIGSDHYWRLMTGEIRRGPDGPVALHTRIGWVLSGPMTAANPDLSTVNLVTTHTLRIDAEPDSLKVLDDRLHSFWSLESLGVSDEKDPLLEEFNNNICFKEGRYEVTLPWRESHSPLPTNYQLAAKRLEGLHRRLRQDPVVLHEYDKIIRDQVEKGIVQIAQPCDQESRQKLHYLPHHAVVRRDKETTKIRVVYDASARSTGPSLNDCLYPGPKFNQKILDILLRFRSHLIPLTADIEKAFLMVSIAEQDRDVLRFLWFDNVLLEKPATIELRFARVVFGVSASPFLLNATVKHHLEKYLDTHSETVTAILQSIYVDDIVFGAEDEESAYKLYRESKEILRNGSFNLRKFTTSCPSLQDKIDKAEDPGTSGHAGGILDETFAKTTLGGTPSHKTSEQKILGVCWDTHSDCFVFDLHELAEIAVNLEPTKRNIVSMVGRFYDPIGVLSPIVVSFKVLIQEICESHVDWDQPLAEPQARKWHELVAELKQAQPIFISRGYFNGVNGHVVSSRLCGFCDASKKAYAAVIYLVIQTPIETRVQFVVSKTRVAPIRSQTIPRLELLSALLLARLMSTAQMPSPCS